MRRILRLSLYERYYHLAHWEAHFFETSLPLNASARVLLVFLRDLPFGRAEVPPRKDLPFAELS